MRHWISKITAAAALAFAMAAPTAGHAEDTMRLEWFIQGQFAGPIVAFDKGYYKAAGVDLKLLPAGPDIKPAVTVAQGLDTFGLGHPNQVIAARGNGVPLVMVAEFGQRSSSTYIARKDSGIKRVEDMPGHSVGLWFGGDEHQFLAMLDAAKVNVNDVKIIPQGYDIVGWLNGDYDVMQVTWFNELLQVYDHGYKKEDLVFLDPSDYGADMVSNGLFTTEYTIKNHTKKVQAVDEATMRGWKEALADPAAAADIILKYNNELKRDQQIAQIKAMGQVICAGPTLEGKFGLSRLESWETVQKILLKAKLIESPIDLEKGFTNAFWEKVPAEYKTVNCQP
jgi:NitT/TauT family transport system substrate-binding protein